MSLHNKCAAYSVVESQPTSSFRCELIRRLACAVMAFSALANICQAQTVASAPAAPSASPPSNGGTDVNLLKQQVAELQAQYALLQAKAQLAQATADAAQSGAKETAANQAAIAQSQATIAQSNRNAMTANYPTNLVTPLEGKMTVDANYKFPPQVLTYTASDKMITDIVDAILPYLIQNRASNVIIASTTDIGPEQRANYKIMLRSVTDKTAGFAKVAENYNAFKNLENRLENVDAVAQRLVQHATPETEGGKKSAFAAAGLMGADAALQSVNSTTQSIIQLISLFRTDTTIAGVATEADLEALQAQFCFHLLYGPDRVRRPVSFRVELPSGLQLTSSPLLDAVQNMQTAQSANAVNLSEAKTKATNLPLTEQQVENAIANLTKDAAIIAKAKGFAKDEYKAFEDKLAPLIKYMTDLDTSTTALMTALETPDSKTGLLPLAGILRTEGLIARLQSKGAYCITLKSVIAGGATKITRNLFTGSKLTVLGGDIFVATFSDHKGQILYSNTSKGFVGFTKVLSTTARGQQDIPPEHHFLWWHWPGKTVPPFSLETSAMR